MLFGSKTTNRSFSWYSIYCMRVKFPSVPKAKIIALHDLEKKSVRDFLNSYKQRVLVGGCFDIIHLGHVTFLQKARAQGDVCIVAIESDAFIREVKAREPFHTQDQRADVLAALRFVDLVVTIPHFSQDVRTQGYATLVNKVQPHIIAVTESDAMIDKKRDHAERVGARVEVVTKVLHALSSSTIATYGALLHD